MFAAAMRSRIGKWTLAGVLLVAILVAVVLVTGVVLGVGPAEHDGVSDLRALPRFGEMVRKVDRAVRDRADDSGDPEAQPDDPAVTDDMATQSDAEVVADLDVVAEPPAPAVARSTYPEEPTPVAEAEWRVGGAKSIIELQRYRAVETFEVAGPTGSVAEVVVTDLSPRNGIS